MNHLTPVDDRLRRNEPLWRHTTWRIGGPADLFIQAHTEDDLAEAVQWAGEHAVPCVILGSGSNVLVADEGFRGLVVAHTWHGWRPTGAHSDGVRLQGEQQPLALHVAASVPLARLARHAVSQGLAGLEWAVGIPGTLAGAITGNAGAHGGCMADVLISVRVLDATYDVQELDRSQLGLSYRSSIFRESSLRDAKRGIILSARITVREDEPARLAARAAGHLAQRRRTQPVGLSAGSVFRNPDGNSAGRLIEAAGLKGARIGGAQVSLRHANFIINYGGATASDVRALVELIQERVSKHSGVVLQPEIVFVGEHCTPPAHHD